MKPAEKAMTPILLPAASSAAVMEEVTFVRVNAVRLYATASAQPVRQMKTPFAKCAWK